MLISVRGHFAMAAIHHGCQVIHNCGQGTDLSPFSWATCVSQRRRYFISGVCEETLLSDAVNHLHLESLMRFLRVQQCGPGGEVPETIPVAFDPATC